jgi:phage terminase Nu1 subunit (DNA packaging protein)
MSDIEYAELAELAKSQRRSVSQVVRDGIQLVKEKHQKELDSVGTSM